MKGDVRNKLEKHLSDEIKRDARAKLLVTSFITENVI